MLKVLIVDDDIITRTNLKHMLDWEKHGFEIFGEAVNGHMAMELIKDNPPDIVITDMSMPVADGIVLIEFIVKKHPQIRVIALSSYNDFDYVRNSMKYGAIDYILKHKLDTSLLHDALETAKLSVLETKSRLQKDLSQEEEMTSAKEFLKQRFITQLLTGEIINMETIEKNSLSLGLDLDLKSLVLVAVEIDDYNVLAERFPSKDSNKLLKAFADISQEVLNDFDKAMIFQTEKGCFVILFSLGSIYSSRYIFGKVTEAVERIRTSIKRYLNITACFCISDLCRDITKLHVFYEQCVHSMKSKFYSGKNMVFTRLSEASAESSFITLSVEAEKKLTLYVKAYDIENTKALIDNLFSEIIDRKISYESAQMITLELISTVNRICRDSGIDISSIYSQEEMSYSKLIKYGTVDDIRNWLHSIYEKLVVLLNGLEKQLNYSENTRKAIEFIHINYKTNISLNDAAEYIGINSSYLSRVFKEECGKGFVEYLNSFRIEKAKQLIENSNLSLKDVIHESGFSNYNYFFKIFRDYTNMTPQEYQSAKRRQL